MLFCVAVVNKHPSTQLWHIIKEERRNISFCKKYNGGCEDRAYVVILIQRDSVFDTLFCIGVVIEHTSTQLRYFVKEEGRNISFCKKYSGGCEVYLTIEGSES